MKTFIASLVTGAIAFFWIADSGYKQLPFSKKIGSEIYTKEDISDNATSTASTTEKNINNEEGHSSSTLSPSDKNYNNQNQEIIKAERVVIHIKTPEQVKAIYMSSWVAGTPSIRERLIKLIEDTELNAVVIDVKDNTGLISWDSRVKDMDDLIDELHSKNIYVIARIASFQDPIYVSLHPNQAVHSKKTGNIWHDYKGVPWVDTGSKDMWLYIDRIAKESYTRGFDEINLDYIRFPTDGLLSDMTFPVSGERAKVDKPGIVADFYHFITSSLHENGIPVSGDLFGIIMVTKVDIASLGQDMHVALDTFDYVSPMVYPSHFYPGTNGFQKPALHPGEIIDFAMKDGMKIADEVASTTGQATSTIRAKYRPWYQDFDMGATYTKDMVRAQITSGENLGILSWMLWDPANHYTPSALKSQ